MSVELLHPKAPLGAKHRPETSWFRALEVRARAAVVSLFVLAYWVVHPAAFQDEDVY